MIIDTHIHFWKLQREDYGWLKPENPVLYKDYLPSHVQREIAFNGVGAAVAVQAAATIEETEYLLELSAQYKWIAGVVGWLDVTSDTFHKQYERLRQNARFVGIRIHGNTFQNTQGEQLVHLRNHLRHMADEGFPIDLLLSPEDIPSVAARLKEVPHLKAAINHLGNPLVQTKEMTSWNGLMLTLADFANVSCKVSGMIAQTSEPDPGLWRPYVKQLLDIFGPQRLMFGSDWPVCLQAGSYEQVMQLFHEVLPVGLSDSNIADITGNNAVSFYSLQNHL